MGVDESQVTMERFQQLVGAAIDALPEWLAPIIGEMAILVEDVPPPDATTRGTTLLGQYRGIPRTRYGRRVPGSLPDTITLFRLPILATCREVDDVPDRVLKVLGHEVGHAMGLGEARLRQLGWD